MHHPAKSHDFTKTYPARLRLGFGGEFRRANQLVFEESGRKYGRYRASASSNPGRSDGREPVS
ncbi:hypothetical protein ANCCAN_17117 [Ancylostoma caninum]|uniref:Uncharacterized protein n=1 Tax=Ancylostoma caninum TaxID=29170 RepID=A0A368FXT2_ANCCA|nr:hypothetical protein ANCCAN_17117 [Ancylostoma caninum]